MKRKPIVTWQNSAAVQSSSSMKLKKFIAALAVAYCAATAAFAQTWTQTTAPNNSWISVASSADGTKLIAVGYYISPLIFLSTNSGATWSSNNIDFTDSGAIWKSAASSADGNTLIAGSADGALYISTNAGAAWAPAPITNFWISVAASADGTKLVAAALGDGHGGLIYTSTNSGVAWITNEVPVSRWAALASSADGTKLVAVAGTANGGYGGYASGPMLTSTNSGLTWTPTTAGSNYWISVACSADGTKLVAANFESTWFSTNSGLTWTWTNNPVLGAGALACSADGNTLVAGLEGGLGIGAVYTSSDWGNTWISNNIPANSIPNTGYKWALAASADGGKLVAALSSETYVSDIFTSYSPPSPKLNLAFLNGNLAVSWLIPSTNLVLQQNSDLTSTNWCNVTNTPVLNFTNLQYQVTLPAPAGSAFFRLKTP
jgi:hypothetical protein